MHNAWWHALNTVGSSATNDCKHISDAAGAAVNAVQRLGWGFPSATTVMRCDGVMLDMHVVCPKQLLLHAARDLKAFEAGESSLASYIGGPPDLEPLRSVIGPRMFNESAARASLRALGEGGWLVVAGTFA